MDYLTLWGLVGDLVVQTP